MIFPWKKKTAKYAGNWSPKAAQPFSYKVQKWLLRNTFFDPKHAGFGYMEIGLIRQKILNPSLQQLIGETEKQDIVPRDYSGAVKMVYLGTLSPNKRVDYAVETY